MSSAAWFNSLTIASREALNNLMRTTLGWDYMWHVSGDVTRKQLMRMNGGSLDGGSGWCAFARCEVVRLGTGSREHPQHPRWQVRVVAGDGGEPSVSSVGGKVKRALDPTGWQALVGLGGVGGQVKLFCHHVSYAASVSMASALLPLNNGAGGSVSHHCDQIGCICPEHLSTAVNHHDNLVRQRCPGVFVVVYGDQILVERPCSHGSGLSQPEKLRSSCRKVLTIRLPDDAAARVHQLYEEFLQVVGLLSDAPNVD